MNKAERETLDDTLAHIRKVQFYLHEVCRRLMKRAREHDSSKLDPVEFSEFARLQGKLENTTYGSDEYKELLSELQDNALSHHYSKNDHHPQFFEVEEKWRDVDGYEGLYKVSSHGKIMSFHQDSDGKLMSPWISAKGYPRVQLRKNGQWSNHFVHRLVANAFLGRGADDKQINHKDGNKKNNRLTNLEWVSPSENLKHAYDNDIRDSNAKYVVKCKDEDILTIGCTKMAKKLREKGYSKADSSGVWRAAIKGGSHLGLSFESYNIEEYDGVVRRPIHEMDIIQLVEMIVDWKAASERHDDGDIFHSIESNQERFGYSDELKRVLRRTAEVLFEDAAPLTNDA